MDEAIAQSTQEAFDPIHGDVDHALRSGQDMAVVQSQTAEVVGFGFLSFADDEHQIVGFADEESRQRRVKAGIDFVDKEYLAVFSRA